MYVFIKTYERNKDCLLFLSFTSSFTSFPSNIYSSFTFFFKYLHAYIHNYYFQPSLLIDELLVFLMLLFAAQRLVAKAARVSGAPRSRCSTGPRGGRCGDGRCAGMGSSNGSRPCIAVGSVLDRCASRKLRRRLPCAGRCARWRIDIARCRTSASATSAATTSVSPMP